MIETFDRRQRQPKSEFKNFCVSFFSEEIGMEIYKFIMRFKVNRYALDVFKEVTPESQQKIKFISYLYENYGLDKLLTTILIYYKRVALNKNRFEDTKLSYIRTMISNLKIADLKEQVINEYPNYMSSYEGETFLKDIEKYEIVFNNYKNNQKEIDSMVLDKFEADKNKDKVHIPVRSHTVQTIKNEVIPIQTEEGMFRCPKCNYNFIIIQFSDMPVCRKCGVTFNYNEVAL